MLGATATLLFVVLAGCLARDELPEPLDLSGDKFCDQCGMLLEAQPGPVGQTFFDDHQPNGRDGPAWFCSGSCTYLYTFDREAEGHEVVVIYMTDYSVVDWQLSDEDDTLFISSHLGADAFARADDLTLLVGSELIGAMGPDLIGFTDPEGAEAVRADHGGSIYTHDEVTPELVASLTG